MVEVCDDPKSEARSVPKPTRKKAKETNKPDEPDDE